MIDIAKARALCEAATPGRWEWWTSDSWNRLTAEGGRDGGVLCPFVNQYDRHPDLSVSEEDMDFIAAARTLLPEALNEIERLRTELATWRAKQPMLDQLADLLGVCEGVCPLRAASAEIKRLRTDLAVCRANHAVAYDGNAPVRRCWNGASWYQLRWNGCGWIEEGIL